MSNILNLTDAINEAFKSGKTPTFIYNGTTYEFSPQGLIDFLEAEGDFIPDAVVTSSIEVGDLTVSQVLLLTDLPTADPVVAGQVWNDAGTLKLSTGA